VEVLCSPEHRSALCSAWNLALDVAGHEAAAASGFARRARAGGSRHKSEYQQQFHSGATMMVLLNGEFVPEERAVVSVFDRSFQYGDGLFDAVLIRNGRLFRWEPHATRLRAGAELMKLQIPWSPEELLRFSTELIRLNGIANGALRIQVSRGSGPRGYAPAGTERPVLVIATFPAAPEVTGWRLAVSSFRVAPGDRLHRFKNTSRLLNVLAAMEAREAGANEALLLDTLGNVIEGTSSTICWVEEGAVFSTPVEAGVLPGTTWAIVCELCAARKIPTSERLVSLAQLRAADGVFATLTTRGVVEVLSIDGASVRRSPIISELVGAWRDLVSAECGV
jgi:branched-chain amino acid aminotransferase